MREVGIVESVREDVVEIRAATSNECAHCPLETNCPSKLSGAKQTILARNGMGAEVGDLVEFEYEESDIIKGIFTIYIIPFLYFLIGLAIGLVLEKGLNVHLGSLENLLSVILSIGFLFVGMFVVREKDKNFRIPSHIDAVLVKKSSLSDVGLNITKQ